MRNLASRTLGLSLRRLSADWRAAHGHALELAETFVDPLRYRGSCYDASNWTWLGSTRASRGTTARTRIRTRRRR